MGVNGNGMRPSEKEARLARSKAIKSDTQFGLRITIIVIKILRAKTKTHPVTGIWDTGAESRPLAPCQANTSDTSTRHISHDLKVHVHSFLLSSLPSAEGFTIALPCPLIHTCTASTATSLLLMNKRPPNSQQASRLPLLMKSAKSMTESRNVIIPRSGGGT